MRVIAGSAKRTQLRTVEGLDTRPTTDRIKETLFNMLAPSLYDCRFLDLFAGSGAIGIEALSRGAEHAVFVEQSRKAMDCIRENLRNTHLEDRAETIQMDVLSALKRLEGRQSFDYIFMDPPYDHKWEKQVLAYLKESALLADDGVIIIEASKETEVEDLGSLGFELLKVKEYKTNKHIFIGR